MQAAGLVTHRAYLSLGSNLGDRAKHLRQALTKLAACAGLQISAVSSIYETVPLGPVANQPQFFNLAASLRTTIEPLELLHVCLKIEAELGRERLVAQGPRVIDIDLLFYDQQVVNWPDLILPHPRLFERAFVLIPLLEIEENLVDPRTKQTCRAYLTALGDTSSLVQRRLPAPNF